MLMCIGSSLEVYPVAQLPAMTLERGGRLAIITKGATPFDGRAAVRMRADVVAALESVLLELEVGRGPTDQRLSPGLPLELEARLRSARA
jgi:NAD-dependent deacetylase